MDKTWVLTWKFQKASLAYQAIISASILGERKGKKHIISSQFEHHAVSHTLQKLEKQGFSVTYLHCLIIVIMKVKIDKIYQPDKNTIILGIYSNFTHFNLNICIDAHNCRINLTTKQKNNPLIAPNFCMLLRKHLIGGKISNIETFGFERLIKIDIDIINDFNEIETKSLIIELMGKHSNIILVNNKKIIIDSLRHIVAIDSSYRDVLPSRLYTFPTSNKLDYTQLTSLCDIFSNSLPLPANEFCSLFDIFVILLPLVLVKFNILKENT